MGLLWLVFLNIFIGIIIAFIVFGPKMRKMGKQLHANTFPEFLGKRFESRKLQSWVGAMITITMPLYAASVMIGAARFIETTLGVPYATALLAFTICVAAYVIIGGMISVIYTDVFHGAIMFIGMSVLFVFTYWTLGGVVGAHTALTEMAPLMPETVKAIGGVGWTAMPALGSQLWWTMITSIMMGVGIGILAQPQLAVRFMTVKNNTALRRAVLSGGPFIFMMVGVAYVVGPLSNVYFFRETGQLAIQAAGGNIDLIMPTFINTAMPPVFVTIFMLSLLATAMSTACAQFHTMGTSMGYDVAGNLSSQKITKEKRSSRTILFTRIGIILTIIMALAWAFGLPPSIIARTTAMFMGLCTSALLPMYVGGLFWKKMTKAGSFASFGVGLFVTVFWYLFIHAAEAVPIGLCNLLFGQPTLLTGTWMFVNPIVIATPLAIIAAIVVSLMTQPPTPKLVEDLFSESDAAIENSTDAAV
jgi:SSS family solute:Na+ symporter